MTAPFVHPQALCESRKVGEGTRVWAFAHVLPGAVIGKECNICDHVFIENDVVLGDRVTVKCGVQLWDGLRVANDVFLGPNATFTNDRFPRSKAYQETLPQTVLEEGVSVGAGAVILPGITLGARAMIGAGAVVTRSVPPRAIVVGNPARIVGYADAISRNRIGRREMPAEPSVAASAVRGVTIHRFKTVRDLRGDLSVGHFTSEVPFTPARYFLVHSVPSEHVRGEHAHRTCHQFLICIAGQVHVIVDDGTTSEEVVLNEPSVGLFLPPRVWSVQYRYSSNAVQLVFASHPYDPEDYIRDYSAFLDLVKGN